MSKEEAKNILAKAGYTAFVENSILMIVLPEDLAGEKADAFYEEIKSKLSEIEYDSSWGVFRNHGKKIKEDVVVTRTEETEE